MNVHTGSILLALTALGASACDGIDESGVDQDVIAEGDDVGLDEDVGTAEEALTIVDHCATSGPNATSLISLPFTSDAYQRHENYINPFINCVGTPRATTILEVTPSSFNTHRYKFRVATNLGPVGTTKTSCENMELAVRLQKRVAGEMVDIDFWPLKGMWITGFGCIAPPSAWEYTRQNKNGGTTETSLYAVRTYATKANGKFATVTITDQNLGP